jgi:hypothetical protein
VEGKADIRTPGVLPRDASTQFRPTFARDGTALSMTSILKMNHYPGDASLPLWPEAKY